MDKKKKGLADTGDGEFILNESGTSVSTDRVENDRNSGSDEDAAAENDKGQTEQNQDRD